MSPSAASVRRSDSTARRSARYRGVVKTKRGAGGLCRGRLRGAYEDHPLPIAEGRTISQPYIVALMLEAAESRGDTIGHVGQSGRNGDGMVSFFEKSGVWSAT
jgi:Protein-L-isoaspartate(D-aspartate) O-methyltransferase (PCMT)